MSGEEHKPLIDPSITFGGDAPDLSVPDFLRRTEATNEVGDAGSGDVGADHEHDASGDADQVAEATEAAAETADAGLADEGEQPVTYPTEPTEAGEQHTLLNPEATVGHNQPEPEPMSREEMLKEFNKDIAAYGKDSGRGAAALPRLGLRVIRAAADGLISTEKPKDGTDSDAVRIYKRYAEQDSKHAEHTKGGMKANAAKLNALIGLGGMTTVDGVDVADRTVRIREKMEGEDQKPKPLFAGLVDVARAQLDQDTALTDDAIATALTKTVKDKSVAEEWVAIGKKIDKLVAGEHGLKDQSEPALKIAELVHEHINNFATNEERDDQIAFLMERGMTRAQAEEFYDKAA